MDTESYLDRIRYRGPRTVTYEALRDLHRAHMFTVPFENLDIHLKRPIVLEDEALFEKIVLRRRGGFCYELNGLFARLLRSLGFRVDMLCARVGRSDGSFGPPFDHMTLLTHMERPWLCDVGFGESFIEPLLLEPGVSQYGWGKTCRIVSSGEDWIYETLKPNGQWKPEYRFDLIAREYEDYAEMCRYHQTSPQSSFTQKRVCSRATPEGRVTLSDNKLVITNHGLRKEQPVSELEFFDLLEDHFGIANF